MDKMPEWFHEKPTETGKASERVPTRRVRYLVIIELLNGPLRASELENRLAGRISKAWLYRALDVLLEEGVVKRSRSSRKYVTYELDAKNEGVRALRSWISNVWASKQTDLDRFRTFGETMKEIIPKSRSNKEESNLTRAATYSIYSYLAKENAEILFQEASLLAESEEHLFLTELNQRQIQKFHEIALASILEAYKSQPRTVEHAKSEWIGDMDRRTVRHLGHFARLERAIRSVN